MTLTFYGWPDNDPPSAETAYDCGRGYKTGGKHPLSQLIVHGRKAVNDAGNGTYDNPLTAASAPGEFDICEIVYLPYIQRYVRVEDTCATCSMFSFLVHTYVQCKCMRANQTATNWNKKQHHIDIWVKSTGFDDGGKVMSCENTLTPKHGIRVVRNPGEKLRVVGMFPGTAYGGRSIVWMLTRFRGAAICGWKVLY